MILIKDKIVETRIKNGDFIIKSTGKLKKSIAKEYMKQEYNKMAKLYNNWVE